MKSTAAKRYAEALHALARSNMRSREFLEQLEAMAAVWRDNAELRVLLTSPRVSLDNKRRVLAAVADGLGFESYLVNLLNLMLDKGRIQMIPALTEEFRNLDDQASGRVRARCQSARPLTEAQMEALRAKLIKITGARDVIVDLKIEPRLLAGFVANIAGKIIDGSLKGRLERLKRSLVQKEQER